MWRKSRWQEPHDLQSQSLSIERRVPEISGRVHRNLQQLCPKTVTSQAKCNTCTSKGNLWAFYVGSRTTRLCASCHHALGVHTPSAVSSYFSICQSFCSRSGPFKNEIILGPVEIWSSSVTLVEWWFQDGKARRNSLSCPRAHILTAYRVAISRFPRCFK